MAIGVSNFPIVDNNLAQRLLGGFKQGQGLHQNYLANQLSQIQNQDELTKQKYLEPSLQEQLQKAIYENQIQKPMAENADAFSMAKLAAERAQAPHINAQTNRINTMTPLEAEQLRLQNQLYPDLTQSLINQRNMGGSNSAGGKDFDKFKYQIALDNPAWDANQINQAASAYLDGNTTLPDGTSIPPPSGAARNLMAQVQRRTSPAAIQTQAANADVTAQEINEINIEPVKKFAGLKGKIDIAAAKARMASGLPVDPTARDYLAFQNESILAMDSLRKSFGTSVVPDYVYATLGKLTNPDGSIWSDPEQVEKNWEVLKKWVTNNASKLKKKATQGVAADISNQPSKSRATLRYNPSTGDFEEIR